MMKFDRIYRTSDDAVLFVVAVDRLKRCVELWRWDADVETLASGETTPTRVMARTYHDHTDRFKMTKKFHDEARRLSKAS